MERKITTYFQDTKMTQEQFEKNICPSCGGKTYKVKIKAPQGPSNLFGWNGAVRCGFGNCIFEKYFKIRGEK